MPMTSDKDKEALADCLYDRYHRLPNELLIEIDMDILFIGLSVWLEFTTDTWKISIIEILLGYGFFIPGCVLLWVPRVVCGVVVSRLCPFCQELLYLYFLYYIQSINRIIDTETNKHTIIYLSDASYNGNINIWR